MRANNYAVLGHFGPFWAVLGHFMSRFWQKLFSKNKNASKRDMPMPHWRRLHPLKTTKHLFWKQECLKKGHAYAPLAPVAPPENGDSFKFKIRTPVFWTIN